MPQLYGVLHAALPVRAAPAHTAAQVDELLFGQLVSRQRQGMNWSLVQELSSGYQGWVPTGQLTAWQGPVPDAWHYVQPAVAALTVQRGGNSHVQWVGRGAQLPAHTLQPTGYLWALGATSYRLAAADAAPAKTLTREGLLATALTYLHAPYRWGGKTLFGLDCSALVQQVFALHGLPLPRDAWQQAQQGRAIDLDSRQPGDLAFFANALGRITHVGIVANAGEVLHASSARGVQLDELTPVGIYNRTSGSYSHKLACLRSVM